MKCLPNCTCGRHKAAHNRTHNLSHTTLFNVWEKIKNRCYNPNYSRFIDYGGRGITMCDDWKNNFKNFNDWCISKGWQKGLQVDRIHNDKEYSPDNCKISTVMTNCTNKRKYKSNTTGHTGVTIDNGSFRSRVNHSGHRVNIATSLTVEDAVRFRNGYILAYRLLYKLDLD